MIIQYFDREGEHAGLYQFHTEFDRDLIEGIFKACYKEAGGDQDIMDEFLRLEGIERIWAEPICEEHLDEND